MSHIFLDRRDGRLALYLSGDLQFDRRDERLYHEALALVPVALAARRARGGPLRVLILGGGDGLALREVLRFRQVAAAHVVDRDPEVLRLGAGELAALNEDAFDDPRACVHVRDAGEFLERARGFDVLILDLTYPRDVAGAVPFTVAFFRRARAALRPGGVMAVNAVSPERTPQAFGCVGATLAAAGLWALPYGFALPSFQAEGYGRWGFFFASRRPLRRAELPALCFPAGAGITRDAVLEGMAFPADAREAIRGVAPNRTDELLFYIYNAAPVGWEGPTWPLRFAPSAAAIAAPGPRITVGEGFARWLGGAAGRRSLEDLLGCLPFAQRGGAREAVLEWSHHAEILFREVDLRAFVEQALRRARGLPRAWVRELRALRDRIRDGLPSMGELLHHAYRVFAVYLLALLLVNLLFPDNLYAKGFSGSRGSGGTSSSTSAPSHSTRFTSPTTPSRPYRWSYHSGSGTHRTRVSDSQGQQYPAQQLAFTDPQGERKPVPSLLALTRNLQVLETGALAYAVTVPGHQFLLEPGRLRVQDGAGRDVVALLPAAPLEDEARKQVAAQVPLIEKAIADHRRWLDWVGWASAMPQGRRAVSEMEELAAIRRAMEAAQGAWAAPARRAAADPGAGWFPIFPGVFLEPPKPLDPGARQVALVTADGVVRRRGLAPPAALGAEDRFIFHVLRRRFTEARDESLRETIDRWLKAHGEALGVPGRARS